MSEIEVLNRMGLSKNITIDQLLSDEDGTPFDVWKVQDGEKQFVLKKAKEYEFTVYHEVLTKLSEGVPKIYQTLSFENNDYLLMEFIVGHDIRICDNTADLIKVIDVLISIQNHFWGDETIKDIGYSFDLALESRQKRGMYLDDEVILKQYNEFIKRFEFIPRTLCHDDLLPFNTIVTEPKAVIIDWEYAGFLPYLTSFSRLIAHGIHDKGEYFYMRDEDKEIAINYYYNNFVKNKGITYREYYNDLNYFLLYEYCEWIMIGNKYNNKDERYKRYVTKAKEQANQLCKMS